MEMKKRKEYLIKYSINYDSGKKWITNRSICALTKYGAIEIIKLLHSYKDISLINVKIIKYVVSAIHKNRQTLGDF